MCNTHRVLACLLLPIASLATPPTLGAEADGVLDRLETRGGAIRKSFSGSSQDAGLPASFTYENPDQGRDYRLLDIGIKFGTYLEDKLSRAPFQGRIYPSLELHRSTKEGAEVKKTGGGLTYEFERSTGPGGSTKRMLFADGKIDLARDSVLDETTRVLTVRVGRYDELAEYGPGRAIRFGGNEQLVLRWMLTGGIEDYRKLPIKTKVGGETVVAAEAVNATLGFGRANLELTPFAGALNSKLKLTVNYTIRRNLSGDDFFGRTTHLTEASGDYYLDADNRFSIGITYQDGKDPSRNFLDEEFSSLGFKLKVGQ